jgi:hypothetical protein
MAATTRAQAEASKQPIKEEPEITLPVPDSKPRPTRPEIPPDEDMPEKDALIKASRWSLLHAASAKFILIWSEACLEKDLSLVPKRPFRESPTLAALGSFARD